MNIARLCILTATMLLAAHAGADGVQWVCSTDQTRWEQRNDFTVTAFKADEVNDVMITHYTEQQWMGFGGCFGELGWDALQLLDPASRKHVLDQLFGLAHGAALTFCRTPIGANDFARNYYSLDDHPGDLEMRRFSIARDRTALIPYIKAALAVNPDLQVWACPWTPPAWMKTNSHYATKAGQGNGYPGPDMEHGQDQFIMRDDYLQAYATYFSKYLTEYKKEGIHIGMIMFQNEPYTINIWPNCSWSPQGTVRFLGQHLGPMLEREHPDVKMWYGTMNTNNLDEVLQVINDPQAGKYITGAGLQWEGKDIVAALRRQFLQMPLMCTENECGNGSNDWAAAEHTFATVKNYIENGVNAYMYFNMVLQDQGTSSWGWNQNSLVNIDSRTRKATFTPEFLLMKHLSHYVKPQAFKLKTMGNDDAMLAFRNPDGSTVIFIANTHGRPLEMTIACNWQVIHTKLPAHSFNTIRIE